MTIAIVAALALGAAAVEHKKIVGVARKAENVVVAKTASPPPTLPANATIPPTIIGMNVNGLSYFSTEDSLYDVIKDHGFFSIKGAKVGAADWTDLKDQVPIGPHGELLHVPKDTDLMIQAGTVGPSRTGLSCHFSPGWTVGTLAGKATQNGQQVTISINPDTKATDRWIFLFHADRDDDALTSFSCRPIGAPANAMFRSDFIADMKPFGIIRFMDWMRTNSEPETNWSKRPSPADMSFTLKGVPVEYMVELANQLHSNPWFTLPFGADDEYQRNFATYVRDHLSPDLKAYAELSNEVWNAGFPQSKQATMLGKAKYPSEDDSHATDYFYGDRLRHMMAIWSEVFAGQKQRLVRVASSQAAWPERAEFVLGHADTARSVDVLAIAPYFGDMPFDVPGNGAQRVDGILKRAPQDVDKEIVIAKRAKAIAMKYGLRLVTYEAGSAYDAYTPEMRADVEAALHDPRFTPIYQSYVARWAKEVGGEMVLFDTTAGVWAHLDYTGQPWREMPKMTGAINVIATLPQGQQRGVKPVTP